jgi:zinc D-Ala-D-Ala carboxypeptidase
VNLTEHFTLEELTVTSHRQFDNTPKANELANLMRVAALLEQVKIVLGGKPIMINSGFRSKQVNDAVGSKDTSQHRIGCAADIRVPGMTPKQVVQACIDADIPYDQIIEEFNSWTHISVPDMPARPPRKQALIIDRSGTRPFK